MLLFGAIAATGAGLHVIAFVIEGQAKISAFMAMISVTVPFTLYWIVISGLYIFLLGKRRRRITFFGIISLTTYILAPVLAWLNVPIALCVLVLITGPAVAIILDEATAGQRRATDIVNSRQLTVDSSQDHFYGNHTVSIYHKPSLNYRCVSAFSVPLC